MLGGTLRGLMWMEAKPFIDSVVLMSDYWLWRAIGGSLMWVAHLVFAYNMYKMIVRRRTVDINAVALKELGREGAELMIVKQDYELMEVER
jgi:cytochrome c oxidase cbb3-type subunit 1